MSWLVYRWLLLYGLTLFVFKGCQSLFLRHTQSGKCIAAGSQISDDINSRSYWVEMVNNSLNVSAQFRYLDTELLQNIKTGGTLASNAKNKMKFLNRLFIHYGKNKQGKKFQSSSDHHLKQTDAGSLYLYEVDFCVQPNRSYVDLKKDGCSNVEQNFTFGSVTQYGTKMKDVHCSPKQYMMVKRADYGDFNKTGFFNDENIDTTCSSLTNCQVKSRCGGNRSCELTMDNNLLPSDYCPDTSKEIYTEYTCVDSNWSTVITAAPIILLTGSPYRGHITIKDGSTWRYVNVENWDIDREKMLCQHLGFKETDANDIRSGSILSNYNIATGDFICYNTQLSGTSCCIHLVPSTTPSRTSIPYVECKVCDKPILKDVPTFPVFSGSGSSNYRNARFSAIGWCASGSTPYLLIDLQKEYHITRVVVMGNRRQTKWSGSYSMTYSHNGSYENEQKITGNKNGYQASTTHVDIFNVRFIKIQSSESQYFCLRIELCGEAQMPASVQDIKIQPSFTSASVTWKLPTSASVSSYITHLVIYLNGTEKKRIFRSTQINIEGLTPYTWYKVEIVTQDGSSQSSEKAASEMLRTKKGSVTNYGTKMENFHCSPRQRIDIKRAVYGDFYKNGKFDGSALIDTKCSALTNCQVKSRCGGMKSCEFTVNDNLLPSQYCPDTGKEIYTEHECVDTYSSTTITASNIRLGTYPYRGYIQIKHGSTWRYVVEKNWDKIRQKMLCQHLGFRETDANHINTYWSQRSHKIATGDVICYNTLPSGTSCCTHLVPSTKTSYLSYVKCKICDNPLFRDARTFPDSVFSGNGDRYSRYRHARIAKGGWCASGSAPYLLIDLQKEYHITWVVVMGNKDQTQWSETYSMKYSHNKTLVDTSSEIQIKGNQNGYQASTTLVEIYNVRHIKIQSTGNTNFCLRIELCGKVQTPAPVYDINITPYEREARVTWRIRTAPENSSYITRIIVYLGRRKYQTISRGTEIDIKRLEPNTTYQVEIETEDGSSQKSKKVSRNLNTKKAGEICGNPLLEDIHRTFPNKVFSGNGGSNDYQNARFTGRGWCPSRSGPYLSLDLQKEYHITRVAVMGDRDQTKWSESYSMKYSHDKTLLDTSSAIKITGNQNGHEASTTDVRVGIYNVRYIKIQSTGNTDFCLRIELCGEVQKPASLYDIKITPSNTSAQVTMGNPAPDTSSYITLYHIELNGSYLKRIRRQEPRTEFNITGLTPFTNYTVRIWAGDGSSQWSSSTDIIFMTNTSAPSGAPGSVAFTNRSNEQLTVSWSAPSRKSQNGKLTAYRVCYSDKENSSNPSCFQKNTVSNTTVIKKLRPATKYFVTVAAATSAGYGPKSMEISKITNGESVNPVATSYSSLNITIIKPATYIKEVMIIVQVAPKNRGLEEIGKSDLKPYQENMNVPYITAYLKADVLPLTFVIGDGKEYNSEKEKYLNQLLEQNSNYIVFLRFFESRDSYYSTEWSSVVKTMVKPGLSGPPLNVAFNSRGKTSLQVSWKAPEERLQNVELTGYQVCFYTRDTAGECLVLTSTKVLSLILDNLQPSTKYFVTVSASTKAGYGKKSSEVSKITSGEPVNPLTTSDYTLSLNIPKPAEYIREVGVIVQIVTKVNGQTPSQNIKTSKLKPYQTKTQDPYITAYLKAEVLPLTFVIGDGKVYSSEKEKYINQPLEENSNYIVFLRYSESQDSYYSTEWSKSVKTMKKRPEQLSANTNTCLDVIIPPVILALCLLLSLAVNVYQRRRLQNNNRKESHKLTSRQADQTGTSDSTPVPLNSKKSMEVIELTAERVSYVNDDTIYETPDDVIESIERYEAESKHKISTEEETSAYISLTDHKEPENFYQPLQTLRTSAHPHDTKGVDDQSAFNLNVSAV